MLIAVIETVNYDSNDNSEWNVGNSKKTPNSFFYIQVRASPPIQFISMTSGIQVYLPTYLIDMHEFVFFANEIYDSFCNGKYNYTRDGRADAYKMSHGNNSKWQESID